MGRMPSQRSIGPAQIELVMTTEETSERLNRYQQHHRISSRDVDRLMIDAFSDEDRGWSSLWAAYSMSE